eukprot:scaffold552_cov526-Prasinococcus_capsulatus_cf.AAC.3
MLAAAARARRRRQPTSEPQRAGSGPDSGARGCRSPLPSPLRPAPAAQHETTLRAAGLFGRAHRGWLRGEGRWGNAEPRAWVAERRRQFFRVPARTQRRRERRGRVCVCSSSRRRFHVQVGRAHLVALRLCACGPASAAATVGQWFTAAGVRSRCAPACTRPIHLCAIQAESVRRGRGCALRWFGRRAQSWGTVGARPAST